MHNVIIKWIMQVENPLYEIPNSKSLMKGDQKIPQSYGSTTYSCRVLLRVARTVGKPATASTPWP